jgi:putative transposase
MPSRLKRYQTEGHYHFLTFSCYHRLPHLADDTSRIIFLETLEQVRRKHQFYLFGYVLMPEHVHLLLTEPKLHRLDTTMSALKGETSKRLTLTCSPVSAHNRVRFSYSEVRTDHVKEQAQ